MLLFADENVRRDVIEALRRSGHDVECVLDEYQGAIDAFVLKESFEKERVLLTFDKGDFGRLIFRLGAQAHGVIVIRVTAPSPDAFITRVVDVISSRDDWAGYFSTIDDIRIRRRRIPSPRHQ